MDFSDVMRLRRMVRDYQSEPVPREAIERILRVVRRAPSAGHSQAHRLVVITNAEKQRQLAEISEGWYLENGFPPWISGAPAQIVLGVREEDYHERYREPDKTQEDGAEVGWPVPFWWFDSGALFILLQLAAINEGLATGFYSPADPEELRAIGSVAEFSRDIAVVGVITLGYPADTPATGGKARRGRSIEDVVEWRE